MYCWNSLGAGHRFQLNIWGDLELSYDALQQKLKLQGICKRDGSSDYYSNDYVIVGDIMIYQRTIPSHSLHGGAAFGRNNE